jgi:hypothetical protein
MENKHVRPTQLRNHLILIGINNLLCKLLPSLIIAFVVRSRILALQVFDQKKFKKKHDQGFLGVVNVLMSTVFDVSVASADGLSYSCCLLLQKWSLGNFENQTLGKLYRGR